MRSGPCSWSVGRAPHESEAAWLTLVSSELWSARKRLRKTAAEPRTACQDRCKRRVCEPTRDQRAGGRRAEQQAEKQKQFGVEKGLYLRVEDPEHLSQM